jgi:tetratricopeptide (TPR) repeat protein
MNQKIDLVVLFKRLESLVGARLSDEARRQLDDFADTFEFVQSDVLEVFPKVKHMNIVDYAEGMALYLAAVRRKDTGARERLRQLRLSSARFARAISTLPDSYITLYQWGLALVEEAKLNGTIDAIRILEDACDKFYSALDIKSNFQGCWVQLGESLLELAKLLPAAAEQQQRSTKEFFKKAAHAFHQALLFDAFFLSYIFKKVQDLHVEAASQRCA